MKQILFTRSTKVNNTVYSKMAATQLMCVGVDVICDYLIDKCHKIIATKM